MSATDPAEFEEIRRTAIKPTDVLVVRCSGVLSMADTQRISDSMKAKFPDHTVIVMDSRFALEVIEATP